MWVDGVQVAAATSPAGSVTEGKEFGVQGIHIGERVDGTSRFRGSLDEVRVYRRALSPSEITRLYETNLSGRRGLALWLPFERVDPN
ncbi:sialidase-1 [Actinopolymorpha cephalotaxi]|nr:LamG-like jellyroll fold domain-containing protein [Actinopolymorpha cephalotaxi]SFG62988.1 sialidase-1 [Actinopolymorpha cephalotaxi]